MYYFDVDMAIVDYVGEEIFGNIVAVKHPGFYHKGGSWGDNKESTSYTFPENRIHYFAGGVQGGVSEKYYRAMQQMKRDIDEDEKNGVMAEWHDETHWNRFLSECKFVKMLTPKYCMVEQQELREKWGVSHFPPIIIALSKDHKAIRE
jgi:histo-blood group ABO system transferase